MAENKGGGGSSDQSQNGFIWGAVLFFILAVIIWYKKKTVIQFGVLWSAYYLVYPFTALSDSAVKIQESIATHPLDFWTPSRLFDLYALVSSLFWRWPVIFVLVGLAAVAAAKSKRIRYGKTLNLSSLAEVMVRENPHIAPTLKLNAYEQPLDGGLLPSPERPISFATKRNLLIDGDGAPVHYESIHRKNGTLKDFLPDSAAGRHPIGNYATPARIDEAAASQIFARQLSAGFEAVASGFDPRSDLKKLPQWALCLAAAMYAMGADMQKDGEAILARLSLNWHPARRAVEPGFAWPPNPLGWTSNAEILAGRVDWGATEDPARPVEVDKSYLQPSWPWSPVVWVKRSIKGFGRERVVRLQWRWRGPMRKTPASAREAGFGIDLKELPYKKLLAKMQKDEDFQIFSRLHHAHAATWFMSLMEWAQRAGSFHTSLFIWLRVQNPALFWVLNQVGGECAWTEGAGAWAHYRTEIMAKQCIHEPCVDLAVSALVREMRVDGWLDARDLK